MTGRDRRLLIIGTALLALGCALSAFVVAALWQADNRLDSAETEQQITDDELATLAGVDVAICILV